MPSSSITQRITWRWKTSGRFGKIPPNPTWELRIIPLDSAMRSFSGLTHKTTQKFRSHQLNANQIGNSRVKLWEHASAFVFWETQILLVWLPLCLWSWYNDFPCDSEMWSSLFGALRIAAHSPTVCTQKQPSSVSCTRPGATESSRRPRSYLPVRNSREVPGSLLSQRCGTRAHLSCSGDSSACTHAFEAAMLAHMWYYKRVLLAETQLFCAFFFFFYVQWSDCCNFQERGKKKRLDFRLKPWGVTSGFVQTDNFTS